MSQAAAVVGAGLLGGVYAGFSMIVMPALGRLDDREATLAMVGINRSAERGPFILLFVSAAAAAIGLAVTAVHHEHTTSLVVAGASLASTLVTVSVNVPLNRRLEREGADFWPHYHRRWAAFNGVRAALATTAVVVAGVGWVRVP